MREEYDLINDFYEGRENESPIDRKTSVLVEIVDENPDDKADEQEPVSRKSQFIKGTRRLEE